MPNNEQPATMVRIETGILLFIVNSFVYSVSVRKAIIQIRIATHSRCGTQSPKILERNKGNFNSSRNCDRSAV